MPSVSKIAWCGWKLGTYVWPVVGGNLHIFEILVFQIGFLEGYTFLLKDFIE